MVRGHTVVIHSHTVVIHSHTVVIHSYTVVYRQPPTASANCLLFYALIFGI